MQSNILGGALATIVGAGLGSVGFGRNPGHRAPDIASPEARQIRIETAERERHRKNAKRAESHARGLANYHPRARAAAAITETAVKPKRVRKPAAAKAA